MEDTVCDSAAVLHRLATQAYSGRDWKKAASDASASRMDRPCRMSSWQRFTTPVAVSWRQFGAWTVLRAHASRRTDIAKAERDDFTAQARHRIGAAVHNVQLLKTRQRRADAAMLRRPWDAP